MFKTRNILLMALVVLTLAACGTQAKKPTQDILLARQSFDFAERLRSAYAAKDFAGLEVLSSDETFRKMRSRIKDFRSVKIEFDHQWLDIKDKGTMQLSILWSGIWKLDDGVEVSESGKCVIVIGGRPLKLLEIRGPSPFAAPTKAGPTIGMQ